MIHLPLTRNRFAIVDELDFDPLIAMGQWRYNSGYAVLYTTELGKRKTLYMHRVIMEQVLGHPVGRMQVDHVNRNRLDNRRENLRLASPSENQAHKGNQVNSSTAKKGVRLRDGKYDVRIRYYHRRFCLGRYNDFDLAVAVYRYAHRLLWGEFTTEGQNSEPLPQDIQEKVDKQLAKPRDKL